MISELTNLQPTSLERKRIRSPKSAIRKGVQSGDLSHIMEIIVTYKPFGFLLQRCDYIFSGMPS